MPEHNRSGPGPTAPVAVRARSAARAMDLPPLGRALPSVSGAVCPPLVTQALPSVSPLPSLPFLARLLP